jgi:hypothetical protein
MRRLINPWEYRHLHGFGVLRIAAGLVASAAAVVCLTYAAYGWAAFFLVVGVLNLAVGYWFLAVDRRSSAADRQSADRAGGALTPPPGR